MTTETLPPPPVETVLFSRDGKKPELDWKPEEITKIVIGSLPGNDEQKKEAAVDASDLDWIDLSDLNSFPNLTHLYLWRVHGFAELPSLPDSLKCLDVRYCLGVKKIPSIPSSALETVVISGLPAFSTLPAKGEYPHVFEFIVTDCPSLEVNSFNEWLKVCPALTHFDASGAEQLKHIAKWPSGLVDFRCNRCFNLLALPKSADGKKTWPEKLRRLELEGTGLPDLGDFPESLDYVNLGKMRQLKKLPDDWGQLRKHPRTLFLHGAGVLMPPASEHGSSPTENVAEQTRAYFQDVEEFDQGSIKRCKVMVLGNGSAGKSCLSLYLTGGDPQRTRQDYEPECDRIISTHGVEFHPWKTDVIMGSDVEEVDVHVWDFGGQEIYHNTHRLFLSTGTIFVLLWKPEQDGRVPDDPNDKWRPLSYWLDYIHKGCHPYEPQIAVVCSNHSESTPELEAKLRANMGDEYFEKYPHYFIDSLTEDGHLGRLKTWISEQGGDVISTQGTCVPSYWEIAQETVEDWVGRFEDEPDLAQKYQQMKPDGFGTVLDQIVKDVALESPDRFPLLTEAVKDVRFEMTPDRIRRTLAFLTHSGWIYWKEGLYDSRAIIGQKWALDGIYTLLERVDGNPNSQVFFQLQNDGGRFTLEDLNRWGWKGEFSPTEQKLLITFLREIGLCFELNHREREWWNSHSGQYISISHLPDCPTKRWNLELRSQGFEPELSVSDEKIPLSQFHKGHWYQILVAFGEKFGTSGSYAKDGFRIINEEGQAAIITAEFDPDYLKGEIVIDARGKDAREFQKNLRETIQKVMGDLVAGKVKGKPNIGDGGGKPEGPIKVFISYTWDPWDSTGDPYYEAPVDAIYDALATESAITPLRDKVEIPEGKRGSINRFMESIGESSYCVVVYSDKYFLSPYCMWELWALFHSYKKRSVNYVENLIFVEHESSEIRNVAGIKEVLAGWEEKTDRDMNSRMLGLKPEVEDMDDLRAEVKSMVKKDFPDVLGVNDMYKRWGRETPEQIIDWIKDKIGLNPPTPNLDGDS